MKKLLLVVLLTCSVLLVTFAFRAVPAKAQSASIAQGTRPNFPPNPAPNAKNSDDDDDIDCPCNRGDASDYPLSVTVDSAGNVVPRATTATATATSDLPDLVPALITSPQSTPQQVAPIFVDAYQKPGRLLYRFDALIVNQGGTLDIFQAGAGAPTQQVICSGGNPPSQPDPNFFTPTPSATVEDRSSAGANLIFVKLPGHNHWHINGAYTYALAGRPVSKSNVGFCLVDGYGKPKWFKPKYIGVGPDTWCAHADPTAAFVREGISPGKADWYPAQTIDQWIDITGLAPGDYTLTGSVNPFGYIDESDISNNTISQTRTIPGAIANATAGTTGRRSKRANITLSGSVVGPGIRARLSGSCHPLEYQPAATLCRHQRRS